MLIVDQSFRTTACLNGIGNTLHRIHETRQMMPRPGDATYQQPAVAGDFAPVWVRVRLPQESPACLPIGVPVTV